MTKKPNKAQKATLGLAGGMAHVYEAQRKADAERSAGNMDVHLVIPLANFINMATVEGKIPEDERARFDTARLMAVESWAELLALLQMVKSEPLRHAIIVELERMCLGVAEMGRFMPPSNLVRKACLGRAATHIPVLCERSSIKSVHLILLDVRTC